MRIIDTGDVRLHIRWDGPADGPVTPNVPASILQRHPRTELFLDQESGALLAPPGTQ